MNPSDAVSIANIGDIVLFFVGLVIVCAVIVHFVEDLGNPRGIIDALINVAAATGCWFFVYTGFRNLLDLPLSIFEQAIVLIAMLVWLPLMLFIILLASMNIFAFFILILGKPLSPNGDERKRNR